jgi:hypothetical protein
MAEGCTAYAQTLHDDNSVGAPDKLVEAPDPPATLSKLADWITKQDGRRFDVTVTVGK